MQKLVPNLEVQVCVVQRCIPMHYHDKMDHAKTAFPRLQVANKMICGLGQLPIMLMNMIAHGHGNERYAQYSNELWPNDPNFTIGSLLWLL